MNKQIELVDRIKNYFPKVNVKNVNKDEVNNSISDTEKELLRDDLDDQKKFLLNHKIEVLKSINLN